MTGGCRTDSTSVLFGQTKRREGAAEGALSISAAPSFGCSQLSRRHEQHPKSTRMTAPATILMLCHAGTLAY